MGIAILADELMVFGGIAFGCLLQAKNPWCILAALIAFSGVALHAGHYFYSCTKQ